MGLSAFRISPRALSSYPDRIVMSLHASCISVAMGVAARETGPQGAQMHASGRNQQNNCLPAACSAS